MRYGSPNTSYGGPTFAGSPISYGGSTYTGSSYGDRYGDGRMHGGAAEFYPGRQAHYYGGMSGEWDDDDF
jgi:hypothetical protein